MSDEKVAVLVPDQYIRTERHFTFDIGSNLAFTIFLVIVGTFFILIGM